MKIRLNITRKLGLILVLFAATLLVTISILFFTTGRDALQSAAISELVATAIEKQGALNAWISEGQVHVETIASLPSMQRNLSDFLSARAQGSTSGAQPAHDRVVAELMAWVGSGRSFQGWVIMDPVSGEVIVSTNAGDEGKFRENQPYFIYGKNGSYVQSFYYSLTEESARLTISAPIRSAKGEVLGVLASDLDLTALNEIILRRTGLRKSDDAFLVNRSELFVTQPRFIDDPAVLSRGVHTEAVRQCLMRNSGMVKADDYRGIPALIVYRWLPRRQLCLIVKLDQAEALAPVIILQNNLLVISAVALLAASILSILLAGSVTRPIHRLVEAVEKIGRGQLDIIIPVKTGDEIEKLAISIEETTKKLKATLVSRDELGREVNERKQAEAARKISEQEYQKLFNEMLSGFALHEIICDSAGKPVNYRFLRVNAAFEQMTGLKAANIIGKTVLEILPSIELSWIERYGQVALSGEPSTFEDYTGALDKYYDVRAFSPEFGKFAVLVNDVTERQYSQHHIEALYRLVKYSEDHSVEEILTKTLDEIDEITKSPIGFFHFLEPDQITISLQAWSTRTTREYCTASGQGMHYNLDEAGVWVDCVRQRQPVIHNDYELLSHRKGLPEGHAPLIRELVVPIIRGGLIVAVVGIGNKESHYLQKDLDVVTYFADEAWEIIQRKKLEQTLSNYALSLETKVQDRTRELEETHQKLIRQERLATLGQVAGTIAHELRNPLGVISNAVYYLIKTMPDASKQVREYLEIIQGEANTSSRIVTELLDFTRVKSANRTQVNVSDIIQRTVEKFPPTPSVELTVDLPASQVFAFADPDHIVHILGTLIINSYQAIPAAGRLQISCMEHGDEIAISVTDNGIGIPPENMNRLFEPLFTTKAKGIGLGLPVSLNLAKANNGRIEVQSEKGKGTTFTLILPVFRSNT